MKASLEDGFTPFTLNLRVESNHELSALWFLFDYAPLVTATEMQEQASVLRSILQKMGSSDELRTNWNAIRFALKHEIERIDA